MSPVNQIDGKIKAEGEFSLTERFWKESQEIYSQSLEKALQPLIEAAQEPERLDWYDIRDYDLSEERKDFRINDFPGEGDIVLVISYTGKAEIKFDSPNADSFDLETYRKIKHTYTALYLTNEAQEEATIKILFGRGDWDLTETVPEIDIQGTIRNDYLDQITDPLKIAQIIEDGHIKEHADIACEKILISGTRRLDQWRSNEDYTFLAPGMILLHATTKLSDWQHPANMTYIHGGQIYTESILTNALAAACVTAEKINVDQLSAIAADVGILTAGLIKSTDERTQFDLTNGFMSVSDGVYIRFKAGKLNGDYGTEIRDVAGNLTVDMGKLAAESDKKNLKVKVNATNPAYKIDVDADHLKLDDSTQLLSNINLTINIAASGANGLDTGAEAANTWYSIWVIHNPTTNTVAGLLSTSVTSPTMPAGYTRKRRVGWVRNDASSNFLKFWETRNWWWWDIHRQVLGTTSASSNWTDVNCSTYVPPGSEMISITAYAGDVDGAGANIYLRRKGSSEDGSVHNCIVASSGGGTATEIGVVGVILSCDTNRYIQYKMYPGDEHAYIHIVGYHDPV